MNKIADKLTRPEVAIGVGLTMTAVGVLWLGKQMGIVKAPNLEGFLWGN